MTRLCELIGAAWLASCGLFAAIGFASYLTARHDARERSRQLDAGLIEILRSEGLRP